jgi:hypothetical protein
MRADDQVQAALASSSRPLDPHEIAAALVEASRNWLRDLFHPYRPERHYMRGPGPKWRAKHLA